jgi:CHAT domain-containing protein
MKAEEYHRTSLEIRARLAPGSTAHADSLLCLAGLLREKGQLEVSAELFGTALNILERDIARFDGTEEIRADRRALYASNYREYLELLVRRNQPERAFSVLERSRARWLLSMIAERDLVLAADLPVELKQARTLNDLAYDRVQNQLYGLPASAGPRREALAARLVGLQSERERIAEKIRRASPRLAGLQYPGALDLAGVRHMLDPGTALLAYSVGPERTILFVVKPEGAAGSPVDVFTIPSGEKSLRAMTQAFRRQIEDGIPSRAALATGARALYELLVKPAEAQLADSTRLLIVPDGPLHNLPFGALLHTSRQYLVEWRPVHTVVSATVYGELKKMRHPPSAGKLSLIAFGDPNSGQDPGSARKSLSSLSSLPFSRDEINGIAALFPRRSEIYVGAEATEERARHLDRSVRYVHFATHAILDEKSPLNSAIVLRVPEKWTEGRENGLLQAWEILEHVRLDADLVVLSACESGRGSELRGEGLIGLTRAFQYAGARSVLASLWTIDDRRTAELMRSFYRHLLNGKSKDEALRSAQMELIHRPSSNPFYWAAFSLFGDWQ